MSARLLLGVPAARAIEGALKELLATEGLRPQLAAILVGDHAPSATYVHNKLRACERVGIDCRVHRLSATTSQGDLAALVDHLNESPEVHGILLQLPLPPHLASQPLLQAIDPRKDVDGLTAVNQGKLTLGDPTGFIPPTALAICQLLRFYQITTAGKRVLIAGRSAIVGRPTSILLSQRALGGQATVTLAHSASPDLSALCRGSDILIAAIGQSEFFKGEHLPPGGVAIDVGIHGKRPNITGDIQAAAADAALSARSPVPGGVGPLTVASLLVNTARAAGLTDAMRALEARAP